MKLYLAQTGDFEIVMIISANSLNQAIDLANEVYDEDGLDDGSGFVFDQDTVEELVAKSEPCVINSFALKSI